MPNFCSNFLTIEGPEKTLNAFIENNCVDGYLSFEKGVSANLTMEDKNGEGWYV